MNVLRGFRRPWIVLVVALVVGATIATMSPGPAPASTVSDRAAARVELSGVVTDRAGRPVADVQVVLFTVVPRGIRPTASVRTDARGRYRVRAKPGAYRVLYQRGLPEVRTVLDAYGQFWPQEFGEENSGTVLLRTGAPTRLDLVLVTGVTVRGRVLGPDGRPVARANVFLHQVDLDGRPREPGEPVQTAEDGTYAAPTLPGAHRLTFQLGLQPEDGPSVVGGAWPDAATLAEGTTFRVGARGRRLADVRLRTSGSISGRISGSGPREAVLARVDDGGRDVVGSSQSTSGDQFRFTGLFPGRYRLSFPLTSLTTVYWPGVTGRASSRVIEVRDGQSRTGYDVDLVTPAISGVVMTPSGTPVSSTRVGVQRRSGSSWISTDVVTTDAAGRYRVPLAALGRYRVGATDPTTGTSTDPVEVTVALGRTARVDPQVRELGALTGTVRDVDGAGVAVDLAVFALRDGTWRPLTDAEGFSIRRGSDADGTFRISLPAGVYRLGASGADHVGPVVFAGGATSVEESASLSVAAGCDTTADLGLLAPGSLSGRVTDRLGLPVGGADVRLLRANGLGGRWAATTDDAGRYNVPELPPGPYVVDVRADGFVDEQHPDLAADDPVSVAPATDATSGDVVLGRGSTATGRVTDSAGRPVVGASVNLFRRTTWGWESRGGRTDSDGRINVSGLVSATYRVLYDGELPNGDHARLGTLLDDEFRTPSSDAPVVRVGDDDTVSVDRVLDSRGTISGTVSGRMPGTLISARLQRSREGRWVDAGPLVVPNDGRYVTPVLAPGTYRLAVTGKGRFPVTTDAGTVTSDRGTRKDVVLTGRMIHGAVRVRPLRRVLVQAVRRDGTVAQSRTTTPSHPSFALGPLRAGTYTVRYRDPGRRSADLYDSSRFHGAIRLDRAAFYTLGKDVQLATQNVFNGRTVEGRVVPQRSGGEVARAQLVRRSGSRWVPTGYVYQEPDGYWWVPGLRAGVDYRMRFAYFDYFGREVADGARIVGGCTLADARSYVVPRNALTLRTGTTKVPARWSRLHHTRLTEPPAIRGTARVGGRLVVSSGSWDPCGVRVSYQWRRDGVSIRGADRAAYRPTRTDAGHRLSVLVTARAAGGDGYLPFRDRGTTGVETARTAAVRR